MTVFLKLTFDFKQFKPNIFCLLNLTLLHTVFSGTNMKRTISYQEQVKKPWYVAVIVCCCFSALSKGHLLIYGDNIRAQQDLRTTYAARSARLSEYYYQNPAGFIIQDFIIKTDESQRNFEYQVFSPAKEGALST